MYSCSFLYLLEEFNDRILRPELSNDEMLSLHEELQKIYKTYCLDESIDKIRFDPFIVEEIQRSKSKTMMSVNSITVLQFLGLSHVSSVYYFNSFVKDIGSYYPILLLR